jgi:hypothetical protein
MQTKTWCVVACMVVATGCAGGAPPDGSHTAASSSKGAATPEWRLGKYSTGDGMLQMVIDRTGEPGKAKLQIAGSKDVVELTASEVRERGTLIGQVFKDPKGARVLFVGTHGHLVYLKNERDELPLRRDGNAAPLGAITVAGTPPAEVREKSASEKTAERLSAIAVTKRFPDIKKEDAGKLDQVEKIIGLADKGMFVAYKRGERPTVHWSPVPGRNMYSGKVDDPKQALAKYKAELFNFITFKGDELQGWGLQAAVADSTPADGTPGLVWDADSSRATFVTLDGGVYEIDYGGSDLTPSVAGSIASWPAPLQHSALGPGEVSGMAELGLVAKNVAAPVSTTQDAWRACMKKSYETGLKKELANLDKENIQWSARSARKKEAKSKWETDGPKQCSAHRGKMETQLGQIIEARSAERKALYEKAKARAAAIGLAK